MVFQCIHAAVGGFGKSLEAGAEFRHEAHQPGELLRQGNEVGQQQPGPHVLQVLGVAVQEVQQVLIFGRVHGVLSSQRYVVIIEHRRLSARAGRPARCAVSALADHGVALVHHVVLVFPFGCTRFP